VHFAVFAVLIERLTQRDVLRDFLMTATPAANEATIPMSPELVFPHFVIGAGYSTEFILFYAGSRQSQGTMKFFRGMANS